MARTIATLPAGSRITDYISLVFFREDGLRNVESFSRGSVILELR
jgi:hypothetical protein